LASEELKKIMEDVEAYPINYNHYYTDTIKRRRQNRQLAVIKEVAEKVNGSTILPEQEDDEDQDYDEEPDVTRSFDVEQFVKTLAERNDNDMETFSCEEALDCLFAIYKVRSQSPPPISTSPPSSVPCIP
jgi:hypothetical protein